MANFEERLEAYSCGDLAGIQVVELFADLIQSGAVWGASSSFGRTAANLIQEGVISPDGRILMDTDDIETYYNF